jgi:zinc protease
LEEAFDLFQDVLLHPSFPEEEFAREQKLTLQSLLTRDDRPAALASELFARALYPDHPYRYPLAGEPETVRALTSVQLRQYHADHLQPSQLHLAIVGDVDTDRILALAERALTRGASSPRPAPPVSPPAPLTQGQERQQTLSRAQTHLMVGFRGARLQDGWRHALEVLSNALSGMGGRLFLTLRDQQSLAYSVTSYSVEGLDPGYFAVYMGTSPDKQKAALKGITAQLNQVCDELLSPAELERAQQNLIGSHEIGLQRGSARAALLALEDCYGQGLDGFLHYAEHIAQVRAEDVREAARRVINWEQSVLAIVGSMAPP